MGQLTQFFQPPVYWQQFEDLTHAVFEKVFGDPSPSKNGRPGQAQKGVDVFGTSRDGWNIGIQCKRMDELDENNNPQPGGLITSKIIVEEYDKARTFKPNLRLWILATTAKRDAKAQEFARTLDEQSLRNYSLGVKLWFWDDFVTYLNNFDDLQHQYYSTVLNVRTSNDQDLLFLETLRDGFFASLISGSLTSRRSSG